MAWARLDDGFHDHPKVDDLSLAAVGLWTLCLTWAHRHRRTATVQGHVTDARVRKLAGKQSSALTGELLAAGLWEPEEALGGYVIHDFDDYLPRARDPEERREAGKKGAAKRWEGHSKPDGNLPSTSHDESSKPVASDSSRASAPAFPSRPVPSRVQPPTVAAPPDLVIVEMETEAARANRLAKTFTDKVKLSNFPAVAGVVRKAIRANYDDRSITAALARLADDSRSVTTETLRIELEGRTPPGRSGASNVWQEAFDDDQRRAR